MQIYGNITRIYYNSTCVRMYFFPEFIKTSYDRFNIEEFKGTCLKQNSVFFPHEKVVNSYTSYKLNK